jgi:hypothetical protein
MLPDWFTRIRLLQTKLPRFQRFEAWDHANVTQMFNTILRGLPIGATLVLEVGNEEPFISRPLKGAPNTGERTTEHLLDGQQRLTALWRGLNNNYEDRTFFVFLRAEEETRMPYYVDSIARWVKDREATRRPFWADDVKQLWEKRMIPLDLFGPDNQSSVKNEQPSERFKSWIRQAVADADEREGITEIRTEIAQIFATFNLPYLSLPVRTGKDTALDVFLKMNTSAAPLSEYDIVVAQIEAGMGESLHDLVGKVKHDCPTIAAYYSVEQMVLYASALLQGKVPTNSTYLAKDFGRQLLEHWGNLALGVKRTATFLEAEKLFDAQRLPTDVVVPVLVAFWSLAPEALDAAGQARIVARKYFWRAAFTDRYERSTASRSLADFNKLKSLALGISLPKSEQDEAEIQTIFDEKLYPLPEAQGLITAGWPKKKDRLARAVLAAAMRDGGLDLADATPASRDNLAQREYHHLFPRAFLKDLGRQDGEIFRALNCALVTWQTNRNIAAQEPEYYLAQRRDANELGDEEVMARLSTHRIPFHELVAGDYDAFLAARAKLIHTKMTALCTGGAN